ncbi:nucleoside hydrolase [Microbispora siamensis]|uniref:Nucleoside hydrolase n=1 Tax=Microbispora siamensis TaxID=564413 RepID=A0ABQ4GRZ2_9ACTN|nr:nucleoside hydrolase [Microbispora siamensis]GIH64120.1 nucleoside hydrolase [Microbispora siamensis]
MVARTVLIDTDTGVDDGLAVIYALGRSELDVVGLTTVFGNTEVEQVTRNTAVILERLGRNDIPLAQGAAKGLLGTPLFWPEIHGADGFGNSGLRPSEVTLDERGAAQLIVDLSKRYAGELEVIALGPLTNVAIALLLDPSAAGRIKRVVWMGGAVGWPGNVSPLAEADVAHDPEAGQIVIESGVPVTLVPLDVTDDTLFREADLERVRKSDTPAAELVAAVAPHYMEFYSHRLGEYACAMHSPLTVGVVALPHLVTRAESYPMAIELAPGLCRGATVADRRRRPGELAETLMRAPLVEVVEVVDRDGFIADFVATVSSMAAPSSAEAER